MNGMSTTVEYIIVATHAIFTLFNAIFPLLVVVVRVRLKSLVAGRDSLCKIVMKIEMLISRIKINSSVPTRDSPEFHEQSNICLDLCYWPNYESISL